MTAVFKLKVFKPYEIDQPSRIAMTIEAGMVPVLIDPPCLVQADFKPDVLVDARMTKNLAAPWSEGPEFVVGLGPGFLAGQNCHVVIETLRGHMLGRVIWEGSATPNTGLPDKVGTVQAERVLRAPKAGVLEAHAAIGDHIDTGQIVAEVDGAPVKSTATGVLRGLIQTSSLVSAGMKIGDVDPRDDPDLCWLVSDKALAIGGGVLEAILSRPDLRSKLYGG